MLWMELILLAMVLVYTLYLLLCMLGWQRLGAKKQPATAEAVTVIVCMRNEEACIGECLQALLPVLAQQEASELILLDDYSEDASVDIAAGFQHLPLRIIRLRDLPELFPPDRANKKAAIRYAVQQAKNELLLFTDADSVPPKSWIGSMSQALGEEGVKVVCAPLVYREGGGFLQRFQQLDLVSLMGLSGGSLYWAFPVMANGANIACRRSVFLDLLPLMQGDSMSSGDDVFLLQQIMMRYPASARFVKEAEAVVVSRPVERWTDFIQQRLRWLSKGRAFPKATVTALLLFMWIFHALCLWLPFLGLGLLFQKTAIDEELLLCCFIPLMVKLSWDWAALRLWMNDFRPFYSKGWVAKMFLLYLPIQCTYLLYVFFLGLASPFIGFRWKGRKSDR